MPRLAALCADPRSAGVADALKEKLAASIKRATVRGEPMYANPDALASNVISKLKSGTKLPSPVLRESVFWTVHGFATLEQRERTRHAEQYGPMCLWDMSAAKSWDNGADLFVLHVAEEPFRNLGTCGFWGFLWKRCGGSKIEHPFFLRKRPGAGAAPKGGHGLDPRGLFDLFAHAGPTLDRSTIF
jgi:hypothetical protein